MPVTAYGATRVEHAGIIYEYKDFPQELLEGKSNAEKQYLLANWPNLDAYLREQLAMYFKCRRELDELTKDLEAKQTTKAELDKQYDVETQSLKKLLIKAMMRLGLMTGTVLTDAVTDFQAGLKKARETVDPRSPKRDIQKAKQEAEMLGEVDRQLQVLKQLAGQRGLAQEKLWRIERRIYETSVSLYQSDPIDQSTPNKYLRTDPHSPLFFAEGEVRKGQDYLPGGELSLNFRNRFVDPGTGKELLRGSVLRGSEEFTRTIEHFTGRFQGIRGDWQFGDNLSEFHKNLADKMTAEAAALNTWTGRQASAAGYTRVIIRQTDVDHVIVTFVKP